MACSNAQVELKATVTSLILNLMDYDRCFFFQKTFYTVHCLVDLTVLSDILHPLLMTLSHSVCLHLVFNIALGQH